MELYYSLNDTIISRPVAGIINRKGIVDTDSIKGDYINVAHPGKVLFKKDSSSFSVKQFEADFIKATKEIVVKEMFERPEYGTV